MAENRLSGFPGGRFCIYFARMENLHEKYSMCALNRIFGFEPQIAHALISHLGSAAEVFTLGENEINSLLGPYSKHKGKICRKAYDDAVDEIELLSEKGISFIGYTEEGYPELLRECEDAPLGLYIRSRTPAQELFTPQRRIAVVGTRDISPYGHEWCHRIVRHLGTSPERPAIVSGLALGTDICAHRQALESNLPTIAVMATGPDAIYPYRNRETAERIADTEGCALITDYPPGTAPLAIHFLRRNRIIAGLSDSTILIESRIKGGGMMTARLAFSYNRDVLALPGRIDDLRSQGCNLLIRNKTAEAIDSIEALTTSLGLQTSRSRKQDSMENILREKFPDADTSLISRLIHILDLIRKNRGINLDDLSAKSGMDYSIVARLTGILEIEGLISMDLLQRCTINARIYR